MIPRLISQARSPTGPRWLAGALGLGITLCAVHARAQDSALFTIEADSCPSSDLVQIELTPLLDEQARDKLAQAEPVRIRVADFGERYMVEVKSESRWVEDAERDCEERARVASVFIAMNLAVTPPVKAPEKPPDKPRKKRATTQLEVLAGLEFAVPWPTGSATYGIRAGVALHTHSWLFSVTSGIEAPIELDLLYGRKPMGVIDLMRIPTELGAALLWERRGLEFGPQLSLLGDVLVFEGRELARSRFHVRMNPGAAAGLILRAPVSRHRPFFSVMVAGYPRDYRLELESGVAVGHAPRLWFGAVLGITREAFP